jgi:hypothetical protein
MTTFADIQTFVKTQARITSTDRDTQIAQAINEARRTVLGTDFFPQDRVAATQVLTAGTQDYALPAAFRQMADESLYVYTTGTTNYIPVKLVSEPDADLWDAMQATYLPLAAQVIAGATTGARKLRVMPDFTATDQTLKYVYFANPTDVSSTDAVGSPDICDAIAWYVLAQDEDWTRDNGGGQRQADYMMRYQRALKRARQAMLV